MTYNICIHFMVPYIYGPDGWTGRPGCQAMSAPASLPQWAQDRGELAVSWLKNAEDVLEDQKKSVTHSMVQSCSIMVNHGQSQLVVAKTLRQEGKSCPFGEKFGRPSPDGVTAVG